MEVIAKKYELSFSSQFMYLYFIGQQIFKKMML